MPPDERIKAVIKCGEPVQIQHSPIELTVPDLPCGNQLGLRHPYERIPGIGHDFTMALRIEQRKGSKLDCKAGVRQMPYEGNRNLIIRILCLDSNFNSYPTFKAIYNLIGDPCTEGNHQIEIFPIDAKFRHGKITGCNIRLGCSFKNWVN